MRCIDAAKKCDGTSDCNDKSDEEGCVAPCPTYRCTSKGKEVCLKESQICDGISNCDSWMDEKLCGINECTSTDLHKCSQLCVDQKQRFRCDCHPGYYLLSDNKTCAHTCSNYKKHQCSQICVTGANASSIRTHVCECDDGYSLDANMRSCKSNKNVDPYLIMANKQYINKLSLRKDILLYEILRTNLRRTVAIDFDWESKRYFWMETEPGEIYWSDFVKLTPQNLVKHDLLQPVDLTVDWIGENLYFTDTAKYAIYVTDFSNKHKKKLYTNKAERPAQIICHPRTKYLYFTTLKSERGRGTISRIGMDGTKMLVFVNTDIYTPQGLAIDHVTDTLYWSDVRLKQIKYVRLTGNDSPKVLLKTVGAAQSLTLFEDFLYYTAYNPRSAIYRTHRWSAENHTVFREGKTYEKYQDISVSVQRVFFF